MEKILILSDIHRSARTAARIIDEHRDADEVIFLGDGEDAFENAMAECGIDMYGKKPAVYQVAGNCDWDSMLPMTIIPVFENIRVCVTHGHGYSVKAKQGRIRLSEEASARGCKYALFGHTHSRCLEDMNGVTMFNPGAVQNGEYGLAFTDNGTIRFEHRSV